MRHDLVKIDVERVMQNLRSAFEEDERLKLDMLDGETELFPLLARLLDRIEDEDGVQAALTEQIGERQTRKTRSLARKEALREAVVTLMQAAEQDKLMLPEATLSLRKTPPKAIVTDADRVPDEYCTFTRKPNMAAIKEADVLPEGVALDNGSLSLTIRRK